MEQQTSTRAGRLVWQPSGYQAFVPTPLPPDPPIEFDDEIRDLLSRADQAIGRLDGAIDLVPNPDLFVMMYIRKEAVLSSQIEGTQASLVEVLGLEAQVLDPDDPADAEEVVNYIRALHHGTARLSSLPLCTRLLTEIHAELLQGTRGSAMTPGEFRRSQNWIGAPGSNLRNARYVPPPVEEMKHALGDLQNYLNRERDYPVLIQLGLVHAQFESIHPFLDGNGRIGRLLMTLMLCESGILRQPMFYLSHYLKQHRFEYFDRLQAVRERGEWEPWLKFLLRGIILVAEDATSVARRIVAMRQQDRQLIMSLGGRLTTDALRLHDELLVRPIVSIASVQRYIGKEFPAASRLVALMERLEILREVSGKQRRRVYRYSPYIGLFEDAVIQAPLRVAEEQTLYEA